MTKPAIQFKDHVGLIHSQAKFGLRWASGAGVGLDYDDMFQIASVAFVVAAAGFNPEQGFQFSTYYTRTAFSEFRREIGIMTGVKNLNEGQRAEIIERKEENARRRAAALPELPDMNYGLAPVRFDDLPAPVEGDSAFIDTLAVEQMTPEEQVEFRQVWRQVTANLSPLAALIVEWLRDPPDALVTEVRAQHAHADLCTASGRRTHGLRDGISIASVMRFMRLVSDVHKRDLLLAEAELEKVVEQIEEIYRK